MSKKESLKGLSKIKTVAGMKRRASINTQSLTYLDLYVIVQEKERLAQEKKRLVSRLSDIDERLKQLNGQIADLQKNIGLEKHASLAEQKKVKTKTDRGKSKAGSGEKEWNVVNLGY